ncbi:unnamed protein product, partial [Closterium sp. NIES-53]
MAFRAAPAVAALSLPPIAAPTPAAAPTALAAPAAVASPTAVTAPTTVTAPAFEAPANAAPAVVAPAVAAPAVAVPAVATPAVAAPAVAARPCTRPCRATPPTEPRRSAEPCRPTEPRRPTEPHCPAYTPATAASAATTATAASATTAATAAMASPTVLTFDAEGRAVDFDAWVDNLQLFLQCDSRDEVSLFDQTSGVSTAPAATADSTVRSQWTTHDAVARLAVRSHLLPTERAHFGQYKPAQSLYDAVYSCYSSPATAALSRLMLPYLFPNLATFATVADLITHLRTCDARYRAAIPIELCAKNPPPPMYITLSYLITCLPDSLASFRDHFLSLCPTELTVHQLEERLTAAEKSILAIGASRGDRCTPFFEGCSPWEAPQQQGQGEQGWWRGRRGRRRRRWRRQRGGAVEVGVVPGVGASVVAVEVVEAAAEVVEAAAAVVEAAAAVVEVAVAVVLVEVQPRSEEAWVVASASSSRVPVRPRRPSSFVSGTLGVGGLG